MGQCTHTADNRNHPSERAVAQCHAPRRRGYIARRARCVTFGPDVRRSGLMYGVRDRYVAFRAGAWRCEGIGLVPTYRIPRIRTTQGTTRGLGGGRTVRKRHVTERRRRTIARERRAHRHVPRRRSLLGPLLLYETARPVKTHANRPNACIFRPSWTSAPAEWDSRRADRAIFSGMVSSG